MSDDEPTFETGDAGAADTYPAEAGSIRKGGHVMLKGKPCKVSEVTSSKTGKHGHAKCHFIGIDIFSGKKYEDLMPAGHNIGVPFVKTVQYQLLNADADTGEVSLLIPDSGETKDDMNLPGRADGASDTDKKLEEEIVAKFNDGTDFTVTVQAACGMEKIIAVNQLQAPK
jgi:translation initiation factor 5A